MPNSEGRINSEWRMTKGAPFAFDIGNWSFLRPSSLGIGHSPPTGLGFFLLRGLGGFLDEFRHTLKFLLKAGDEVGRPVLKEDDKAESEKHKQQEPEQTTDEAHAATLTYWFAAVNDPVRSARQSPSPMLR